MQHEMAESAFIVGMGHVFRGRSQKQHHIDQDYKVVDQRRLAETIISTDRQYDHNLTGIYWGNVKGKYQESNKQQEISNKQQVEVFRNA